MDLATTLLFCLMHILLDLISSYIFSGICVSASSGCCTGTVVKYEIQINVHLPQNHVPKYEN